MSEVISIQKHQLYERALIGGQFGMFPFVQMIYWLRKAQAVVTLQHGGVELKQWACYVDSPNEFLGCVESALLSYDQACQHFGITRGSTLQAIVRVTITDIPHAEATPAPPGKPHGLLSPIDLGKQWSIKDEGTDGGYRPIAPAIVEETDVVVSTTEISAPVRTKALLDRFIKHHRKTARKLALEAAKLKQPCS